MAFVQMKMNCGKRPVIYSAWLRLYEIWFLDLFLVFSACTQKAQMHASPYWTVFLPLLLSISFSLSRLPSLWDEGIDMGRKPEHVEQLEVLIFDKEWRWVSRPIQLSLCRQIREIKKGEEHVSFSPADACFASGCAVIPCRDGKLLNHTVDLGL